MRSNYGNYVIQKALKIRKGEFKNKLTFKADKNVNKLILIYTIKKVFSSSPSFYFSSLLCLLNWPVVLEYLRLLKNKIFLSVNYIVYNCIVLLLIFLLLFLLFLFLPLFLFLLLSFFIFPSFVFSSLVRVKHILPNSIRFISLPYPSLMPFINKNNSFSGGSSSPFSLFYFFCSASWTFLNQVLPLALQF